LTIGAKVPLVHVPKNGEATAQRPRGVSFRARISGGFGMTRASEKTESVSLEEFRTPPSDMVEFVKNLICDEARVSQRGEFARHPLVYEAMTVPLDEQLQPVGHPFKTLACNVSLAGASLVHNEPIHASFLRVSLDVVNLGTTMVAKVRRYRQIEQQYFEVDCEFVSRAA
jgi:hypothetical protein